MAKRKDAPSSVVTRSSKATPTAIQASKNPLNTRKSPRFEKQIEPTPSTFKKKPEKNEKQMSPTPSTVKKKPEKSEKQTGSTPLRRSERGKNPVEVPASNVKSAEESADISEESAEDVDEEKKNGSRNNKKRMRCNAVEFRARYKPQRVRVETEGSKVLAHAESPSSSEFPSSSGDQFWSAAVANETADGNAHSLYQHLKPTVSELCNILKFSEGAKIIVERFLKFVVGNFNVSKEHTSILHALLISVCWICSSLLNHTIDRKETFALATTHLNFSCEEEEADQVYEKLLKPKEMFLQNPMSVKVLNAFKDRASRSEEPIMLPAVPVSPQDQERENHGSSNEETLQRNEIGKFETEWNKKKMSIVNDFELEKALIRYLYKSNSCIRSQKLKLVEKEFADALNKHEKLRPAHETHIVDLVHDTCPVVVPDGVVNLRDSSNDMVSRSHTSEKQMANATVLSKPTAEVSAKQDADVVNDVAVAVTDATLLSEPVGDSPAKYVADMANDVAGADATVLSKTNENIPDIEESASEQDKEVENVVSGDDAMVLSEPVGDIPAKQHADMEIDVAGQAERVEMEVPQVHFNKENAIGEDASSSDGPHAVEARIETGQNDLTPHVDLAEMEIPATNNLRPHADSADGSRAVEDPSVDGSNDMAPRVDPCEMIMPAVNDVAPNVDSADGSRAIQEPPVEDISLHADSDQVVVSAANDLTPDIEDADVSHAVEDPNETGPNHVAPNIESAAIPADNCNQDKAHDTTPSVQQVASPVSDHSMPVIPETHNDSHLLQQPSENGTQGQERQTDPTPMVEIENEIIPEDSALGPHDEPSSVISTENQAATPSTSDVLVQTTAPPITAQAQIQLEQYMLELQRTANSNQAGSRKSRRVDPLHIELEQLSSVKDKMVKSYHENILKMNTDCEKEIRDAIAEIRLKYCNKRQKADATFSSQKKEVENSMNTVAINQMLAAAFRLKCQDVSRGCAAVLQACQAESMRQQSMFRGSSTCSPGQSSGAEQAPPPPPPPPIPATAVATPPQQTQPPLQIVHQPSDLFLSRLTKHPRTIYRPPSMINPITPSTPTTTTRSPHGMNPLTGSRTYRKILPAHHVTSSLPLTSPSNSQPLNSTSLPCDPSVPKSGGPQDKLNDNVNALTDNAAHEVVYLSDDD